MAKPATPKCRFVLCLRLELFTNLKERNHEGDDNNQLQRKRIFLYGFAPLNSLFVWTRIMTSLQQSITVRANQVFFKTMKTVKLPMSTK
jgi:hypothetical protein